MKTKGVGATRLSYVLEVTRPSVNNWMAGRARMTKPTVLIISQLLECDPEELDNNYDYTKEL